MFNKRLIAEVPAARPSMARNVLFQWLGLLCNIGCTLTLCHLILQAAGGSLHGWLIDAAIILALALLRSVCIRFSLKEAARSSHIVKKTMRRRLFEKAARIGSRKQAGFSNGQLAQLTSEGADQLESYFANYLPQFFYALIAPMTLFVLVAFWDLSSAIALLVCVPLIPASIVAVQKFAKKLLGKYWGRYAGLADTFLENLQGLTTLKVYGADEKAHQKLNEEAESFRKMTMRVLVMQLNSISVMDLVAYGGAALGIVLALLSFAGGSLSAYHALAIILLSAEFFLPMRALGSFFHVSMNGSAAADRMFSILDLPEEAAKASLPEGAMNFSADDMNFEYEDGQPVLHSVSFDLPEKGLVGICGESGSGKSTLASLLQGRIKDNDGSLRLNGMAMNQFDGADLQKGMAFLSSESRLFSGTVKDNLMMANPDADEKAMVEALETAGVWKDLKAMNGLDTAVLEDGGSLSKGQGQRVALARALLKKAPVLILDEATSAIDADTENDIMAAVNTIAKDQLVICISHRLANLDNADLILVLKDGALVEQGHKTELENNQGEYARMAAAQRALEAYSPAGKEALA